MSHHISHLNLFRRRRDLLIILLDAETSLPIPNAHVSIDSLTTIAYSNSQGVAFFPLLKPSLYSISLQHDSYVPHYVQIPHKSAVTVTIILTPRTAPLSIFFQDALSKHPLSDVRILVDGVEVPTLCIDGMMTLSDLRRGAHKLQFFSDNFHSNSTKVEVTTSSQPVLHVELNPLMVNMTGFVLTNKKKPIAGASVSIPNFKSITDIKGAVSIPNLRFNTTIFLHVYHESFIESVFPICTNSSKPFTVHLKQHFFELEVSVYDNSTKSSISPVNLVLFLEDTAIDSLFTDGSRVTVFEGLEVGYYTLQLLHPGFWEKSIHFGKLHDSHDVSVYLEPKLFSVTGICVYELSPVPGVRVSISGSRISTVTDQDGGFSLYNVRFGSHVLHLVHDKYETFLKETINVYEDLDLGQISLSSKAFWVRLTVFNDKSKQPLPGALASLQRADQRIANQSLHLFSDDTGQIAFQKVPAGGYEVTVQLMGFHLKRLRLLVLGDNFEILFVDDGVPISNVSVVIDGFDSGASGTTGDFYIDSISFGTFLFAFIHPRYEEKRSNITVNSASSSKLGDISLYLKSFVVNLTVVDSFFKYPVSNVSCSLLAHSIIPLPSVLSDELGSASFEKVLYGTYDLKLVSEGYKDKVLTDFAVTSVIDTQIMIDPILFSVYGKVRDSTEPIPNVNVSIQERDHSVLSSEFGSFAFPYIAYGNYSVSFSHFQYDYLLINLIVNETFAGDLDVELKLKSFSVMFIVYDSVSDELVNNASCSFIMNSRTAPSPFISSDAGFIFHQSLPWGVYELVFDSFGYNMLLISNFSISRNVKSEITLDPFLFNVTGIIMGWART
ncbi:hypothetical protein GEMRC1_002431 [Eukaryota sp. GEM-RC1]